MSHPPSRWADLFRGRLLALTLILNIGVMLHAVDVFVIVAVLPAVVREIGGAGFFTWATMVYMVASIVGAASGARLAASLDQRRAYCLAAVAFLAGTAATAAAPSMALLLLGRVVQGLGGGLVLALSYTLIRTLYPVALRTLAITTVSGVWGVAALAGPLLGGLMADIGWWRGAFWLRVPVIAAFALAAWLAVPAERTEAAGRWPWRRLALLSAGVVGIGLSGQFAAPAFRVILMAVALAVLALMLRLDAGAGNRLFPTRPVSLRHPVGLSYWMIFLYSTATGQIAVFLPLGVQVLHGLAALPAAYVQAALALSWTLAALAVARLSGRQIDVAMGAGMPIAAAGVGLLAFAAVPGPLWLIVVAACAIGFGIGICHAHLVAGTMQAARPGEEPETAGGIPTTQSLGIAIGAAVAGIVANLAGLDRGLEPATVARVVPAVYGFAALSPLLATLVAWRLLRQRRAIGRLPGPLGAADTKANR